MARSRAPSSAALILRTDARAPQAVRLLLRLSLLTLAGWSLWHLHHGDRPPLLPLSATLLAWVIARLRLAPMLHDARPGTPLRLEPAAPQVDAPAASLPLWQLDGHAGTIDCIADAGDWMLLRHRAATGGRPDRWLALARRDQPAQWHRLRCAVHAGPPDVVRPSPSSLPCADR